MLKFSPCHGQYGKCGKVAVYHVASLTREEPHKYVCKTHVSWALSHTAYMTGDVAQVTRLGSAKTS